MTKTRGDSFLRKGYGLLIAMVSSSRASSAFFICLLVVVLVYRIQLTIGLFSHPVKPFDFNPTDHSLGIMLASLAYDLSLVLVCFLLCWLLSQMTNLTKRNALSPVLTISGVFFLHIVLLILILIHGVHGRLLFDVQTGFDMSAVKEAFSGISLVETIQLIEISDYAFLLLPFGLFWMVFLFPLGLRVWMAGVSMALVIFLLLISLLATHDGGKPIPAEIRLNPTLFLLYDVAENIFFHPSVKAREASMLGGNRAGVRLSRSMEYHPLRPKKNLPVEKTHPWNILFFVMESVGSRYIFHAGEGHPLPMPFLHQISKGGWFLKNHYTTSNVSTKAIFSLFSGVYDFFKRENFGTRVDAEIPALYNWVGERYDRFLVTPSSISWYFPTQFIKNSGLQEIHSYENLKFKIKEEFHSLGHYIARDEVQTVDFFIQRLTKAREPFLGIYISFVAHFPYFDYGEEYRIMHEEGRLISRYYNNLNLLDHMVKRVVDHLKTQGLLERTILVIVGDHGQAFGQHHSNNFMHYRYSYNENLETPAIFYQPALFKPKAFEFPTSHVDILPTLLDAMGIPYPPEVFDGESLFRDPLKKRSIYFYGYEESISSLDSSLIKVQYSLKKNRCWVYDLKRDPDEKTPLDCSHYPLHVEALHQFVSGHDEHLLKYNVGLKEKRKMSGIQSPVIIE
ncbi:MAG: sulfatase-like hydrolase/transferase [Syntrophaceae bacterium]|nr:sulfatase-like hydrolase/transferase [Syntrophaceae bacterium]